MESLPATGGVREARQVSEAGYFEELVKSWRRNLYISGKILFEPDACSAKPFQKTSILTFEK